MLLHAEVYSHRCRAFLLCTESVIEHALRYLILTLLSKHHVSSVTFDCQCDWNNFTQVERIEWHWYSRNSFAYYESLITEPAFPLRCKTNEPNFKWTGWRYGRLRRKQKEKYSTFLYIPGLPLVPHLAEADFYAEGGRPVHRGQEHSWSGHELSDLLKGEAAVVRWIAGLELYMPGRWLLLLLHQI